MSVKKRVTFNQHNEPVVTLTITGWHDIVRVFWHFERAQVEFADVARRVHASLRRKVGGQQHRAIVDYHLGRVSS